MEQVGIYEKLITQLVEQRLDKDIFFVGCSSVIQQQAISAYCCVLKINQFGELWAKKLKLDDYVHLFLLIQSLKQKLDSKILVPASYNHFIIGDAFRVALSREQVCSSHKAFKDITFKTGSN